jgi:hypothetical protein
LGANSVIAATACAVKGKVEYVLLYSYAVSVPSARS